LVFNLARRCTCHDHWSIGRRKPQWCVNYFGDYKVTSQSEWVKCSGCATQAERFRDFAAQCLSGVLGTVRGRWRKGAPRYMMQRDRCDAVMSESGQ
jgi:hypothetical protein